MTYSLPSVESMLKALNYSNEEIIEDVLICLTGNHMLCFSYRSETWRSMWNCLVVTN